MVHPVSPNHGLMAQYLALGDLPRHKKESSMKISGEQFGWAFSRETATHRNTPAYGLANCLAQRGDGLSRTEAYRKLVLVSAADYRSLVGILSDPNNSFGVYKDFHAVHIFKHDKVHVASFL